jgi:hypothetical protein
MDRIANDKLWSKPVLLKLLFLMIALALIVSLGVAQVRAKASTVTTDKRVDLNLNLYVPCAAAGAGEYVAISGPLNLRFVTTLDGKGGFQSQYELQPKDVIGQGVTTGALYQGTGVTDGSFRGLVGTTVSFEDGFKLSGAPASFSFKTKVPSPPSAGSFVVRADYHVTVNSKGGVTVSIDNFRVKCKRPAYPSYPSYP